MGLGVRHWNRPTLRKSETRETNTSDHVRPRKANGSPPFVCWGGGVGVFEPLENGDNPLFQGG